MYTIIYSAVADNNLDIFINSYKKTFTDLFFDSGIQDVEAIICNYEKIGDDFYHNIRGVIRKQLTSNLVLGRQISDTGDFSILFHERSFLIVIDYTEDVDNHTRYIENIIFTKK